MGKVFYMKKQVGRKLLFCLVLSLFLNSVSFDISAADLTTEEKQKQLQELQTQLRTYQQQLAATQKKGGQVQKEISTLDQGIKQTTAIIANLTKETIEVTSSMKLTENNITKENKNLVTGRTQLAETLRLLSQVDTAPLLIRIFQTDGISHWFLERRTLADLQAQLNQRLTDVQQARQRLEEYHDELADKGKELATAKALKEIAAKQLTSQKQSKTSTLKNIKAEEQRFRSLADLSGQQIQALIKEISSLQESGVSLEDAVRIAIAVGNKTNIRPALLLGVLEVETRLGQFLGTGKWLTDMHPRDHEAFLAITKELGLDPDKMPVSKKPDYGWGGAMGPAQFLPQTWVGYKAEIASFTGHNPPSPWNFTDAFTAAALFLKHRGAVINNATAERKAVKSYISGDPNCLKSICEYYANLVMSKAQNIEKELLAS